MSPNLSTIDVSMSSPQTPQMGQKQWSPDMDTPSQLIASPSSPESPCSPASPPPHSHWSSLDGHIMVADSDSPRSLLRARQSLSRQASVKRRPAKVGELTVGSQIGSGAFSRIYQGYGSRGMYAVKSRLPSTSPEIFNNEQRVLKKLITAARFLDAEQNEESNESRHIINFYPELSEADNLVFQLYDNSIESLVLSPMFQPDPNDFDFFDYRKLIEPLVGLDRWINWAGQLISGLRFIHSQNVVHADLKPDNILIKGDNLVIADFSGAIDLEATPESTIQKNLKDGLAWSPVFTERELRSGKSIPSPGSDIYSLGLILAFCATGQEPYSAAKNATQKLMWMEKIEPLDSYNTDAQPRFTRVKPVIEKCLTQTFEGIELELRSIVQ